MTKRDMKKIVQQEIINSIVALESVSSFEMVYCFIDIEDEEMRSLLQKDFHKMKNIRQGSTQKVPFCSSKCMVEIICEKCHSTVKRIDSHIIMEHYFEETIVCPECYLDFIKIRDHWED